MIILMMTVMVMMLKFTFISIPSKDNPILSTFNVYFNAITSIFILFYSLRLVFYSYFT